MVGCACPQLPPSGGGNLGDMYESFYSLYDMHESFYYYNIFPRPPNHPIKYLIGCFGGAGPLNGDSWFMF